MRLSLAIVSGLVLIGASVAYTTLSGKREAGIFNVDPPTPYFHYSPSGAVRGRVLAVHGLNSNKNMLNLISCGLADAGLEVFTIDLPGHGRSEAPFNALQARNTVAQVLEQLGPETLVLGHSLGGALLVDVIEDHRVKSMVLFSPAPIPVETIQADRILLFEGEFDPGRIQAFAPNVQAAAQGSVEFHVVPWTGHTGALTRPWVIKQTATWLGGDALTIHTGRRLGLLFLMLVASLALGLTLVANPAKPQTTAGAPYPVNASRTIVVYIASAAASALACAWLPVTAWLHLFATDYLLGYLFLLGLTLSLTAGRVPVIRRTVLVGVAAMAYLIAVPGILAVSEFTQITLSDGRWWRFPAIALLSLPLFWADEILIRAMPSRWKSLVTGIVTRILLTAITVTAVLTIYREAAFAFLITGFLLIFWIALWFAGDVIHRKTRDPFATAVFLSLVQGWVFAAVFVTT